MSSSAPRGRSRWAARVVTVALLVLLGVASGRGVVLLLERGGSASEAEAEAEAGGAPSQAAGATPATRAVRLIRDWDRRRAAAYARGDHSALRRLYVPGSRAGRADVRILEAYAARGLVVRGLRMQLLQVEAGAITGQRLRVQVTGRVTGARAAPAAPAGAGGRGRLLPHDAPSTHVLELRRSAGAWRVRWVRPVPARSSG